MYHPYFRGKQYELIAIKEEATVLSKAGFCPIIEPVRESLGALRRALDAIIEADGGAIVIINPHHGDLANHGDAVSELLEESYLDLPNISAGILLKPATTVDQAIERYEGHRSHSPVFIHAGFNKAKRFAAAMAQRSNEQRHIFLDDFSGKLYQRHFKGAHRVLVKDGFERKRNADYDPVQHFSDLHATFADEGMDGFGDFLIVGDDFSETGGPAYAVAIHLTFIDSDQDESMQIYHFVSDSKDTPKDPAGKFSQALKKMILELDAPSSKILESTAVAEFRSLHRLGHFPGLGYVKKLSMKHHIETMADYFSTAV